MERARQTTETRTVIAHADIARSTCAELVRMGKDFSCQRTPAGWLFVVRAEMAQSKGEHHADA